MIFLHDQLKHDAKMPMVICGSNFLNESFVALLTMSLTMRCPEANAMELGGVETGSMKA